MRTTHARKVKEEGAWTSGSCSHVGWKNARVLVHAQGIPTRFIPDAVTVGGSPVTSRPSTVCRSYKRALSIACLLVVHLISVWRNHIFSKLGPFERTYCCLTCASNVTFLCLQKRALSSVTSPALTIMK